jgi:hypothetical protein
VSHRVCALSLVAACCLLACGSTTFQPARNAGFELDSNAEINDDDVRKAFEARPQMRDKVQIAYYTFDATKGDEIEATLKALPGVSGTYRIPSLLATGQRRFDERRPWDPPVPFSIKKLRLLAARAHCDLLVVFDYANRVDSSANGLAAFNVLILPALFVPFLDVKATSYMDSFVVDTRNGYLYAHVDAQKEGSVDFQTIYSSAGERMVRQQWPELLKDTSLAVSQVLASERSKPVTAPPATPPPTPATPPSAAP